MRRWERRAPLGPRFLGVITLQQINLHGLRATHALEEGTHPLAMHAFALQSRHIIRYSDIEAAVWRNLGADLGAKPEVQDRVQEVPVTAYREISRSFLAGEKSASALRSLPRPRTR